ncbi:hypothetical protein BSLA_03f1110 [Burkholderia stabilis]|nr:hypothetical protein BSLA_03f1110 [Burkholderia stabilis]
MRQRRIPIDIVIDPQRRAFVVDEFVNVSLNANGMKREAVTTRRHAPDTGEIQMGASHVIMRPCRTLQKCQSCIASPRLIAVEFP